MKIFIDMMKAFIMTMIIMMLIWIFVSWLNVGFNNQSPETIKNIWDWNFFRVFF